MDDFRKMQQRTDNGKIDPCRDFLSVRGKANPHFGNFVCAFDYDDTFDIDTMVFLR